jgi:hypothetical protein
VTTDHIDRLYGMLEDQNETMAEQGRCLARMEQAQMDLTGILKGVNGQPGLIHIVATHSQQLNVWRGAFAVLAFLWTGAAAWAGIAMKRH